MGLPHEGDWDLEVFDLQPWEVRELLETLGQVIECGKQFGVFKLTPHGSDLMIDVSLPRAEVKTGPGHKDFEVRVDPYLPTGEACLRRNYTVNSMLMDPFDGELFDFFGAAFDCRNRLLLATSEKFKEDPLRPLIGMQLAGRYDMRMMVNGCTTRYCREMLTDYGSLPKERVFGEWYKWAAKSTRPSAGLHFLIDAGWIGLYQDLDLMSYCPQDPEWHPEGTVLTHTMHVCDAMAAICERERVEGEDKAVLLFAALCHDMGKAATTLYDGRWRSPGHAEAGVPVVEAFLDSIGCFPRIIDRVLPLVKEHMFCVTHRVSLKTGSLNLRLVRRLLQRLGEARFEDLIHLIEADHSGRPPLPGGLPEEGRRLAELRASLPQAFERLVQGRHLIEHGMTPGPHFGPILKQALEAQLDGEFTDADGGIRWLQDNYLIPGYTLNEQVDAMTRHFRGMRGQPDV
jgi:tRNA nucleotidyltransferase (CCA-adding enzyme)